MGVKSTDYICVRCHDMKNEKKTFSASIFSCVNRFTAKIYDVKEFQGYFCRLWKLYERWKYQFTYLVESIARNSEYNEG
jgi:hypothetical protein